MATHEHGIRWSEDRGHRQCFTLRNGCSWWTASGNTRPLWETTTEEPIVFVENTQITLICVSSNTQSQKENYCSEKYIYLIARQKLLYVHSSLKLSDPS